MNYRWGIVLLSLSLSVSIIGAFGTRDDANSYDPEDLSARLPLDIMELDFRQLRNLVTRMCLEYDNIKNSVQPARCNITKENQLWHHDKLGKRFHTKGPQETCLEDIDSIGPCGHPLMSYDFNDNKLCRTVTQQCLSDPTRMANKPASVSSNQWEFVKLTTADVNETVPDLKPDSSTRSPLIMEPRRSLRLRLEGWDSCLEHRTDKLAVDLKHCDPNNVNQLWNFDPAAKRIRTTSSNSLCLRDNHSIASCSEPLTNYKFTDGKLCQTVTGNCLHDPTGPEPEINSKVALWELAFVPKHEVGPEFQLIKNQASGRCVSADKDTIETVACDPMRNQSHWTYEPAKGLIRNRQNPYKCLSNTEDRVLELADCSREKSGWSSDEHTIWPRDRNHQCILKLYSASSEYPVSCDSETSHTPPDRRLALAFHTVPKARLGEPMPGITTPKPADSSPVLAHYRLLKPHGTNKCLMTYFRRVHVGDCGPRAGGLWWLDTETGFLRNKAAPDKCLVGSLKRPLALGECTSAARWTYDGRKLRHQSMEHTCLNGTTDIDLEKLGTLEDTSVSDCDSANGFDFIDVPPKMTNLAVKSGHVLIRNEATNKCLGSFYGDMASLVECNANVTKWQFDPNTGFIKAIVHDGTTCLSSSRQDGLGFINLGKCEQPTRGWILNGSSIHFSDWSDTCLTNSGSRNVTRNPVVGNRCLTADDKGREAQVWRVEMSPVV